MSAGVTDTRGHMNWLDDDLACRTVADRVAMYRKYPGQGVRVLQGRARAGPAGRRPRRRRQGRRARPSSPTASTTRPRASARACWPATGDVWYACIPWLWKLRDTDGDGKADRASPAARGLRRPRRLPRPRPARADFGPDGRLYFSIGDRGFNVTTSEGRNAGRARHRLGPPVQSRRDRARGLRHRPAQPAGAGLRRVRQPVHRRQQLRQRRQGPVGLPGRGGRQRLADRLPVHRGAVQPRARGTRRSSGTRRGPRKAAYLVPPIANIADGPSGLTYDPGVEPAPRARTSDHFFLVDFRGSSGQSGIRSFAVKPQGGLVRAGRFAASSSGARWRPTSTSAPTAPSTSPTGSRAGTSRARGGSIACSTRRGERPARSGEVKTAAGRRDGEAIERRAGSTLLAHADMRVRQEAQFELARSRRAASPWHGDRAVRSGPRWPGSTPSGAWARWPEPRRQGRRSSLWPVLEPLLADRDAEVRAQAARVVGDARDRASLGELIGLLARSEPPGPLLRRDGPGQARHAEAAGPLARPAARQRRQGSLPRHAARDGPGRPEGSRVRSSRRRRTRRRPCGWASCWPCDGSRIPRSPTS